MGIKQTCQLFTWGKHSNHKSHNTTSKSVYIQRGRLWGCSIYFNPIGGRPGIIRPQGVEIDPSEFPADWFEGLEDDMYKARRYIAERNKYKVGSVMAQFCVMMNSNMCRGCTTTAKRVLGPDVHLAHTNARCAHKHEIACCSE